MNTLIPLEYYTVVFYTVLLIVVLFVWMRSGGTKISSLANIKVNNSIGMTLLVFTLAYIGLRPISGKYFGDMRVYATTFEKYASGDPVLADKDIYFQYFMKWASGVMTIEMFFLACAMLYIVPLYFFSRKVFGEYWFHSFLILVVSFSFWSFGVNGIRNGIATSMFLLAIAQTKRSLIILFCLLALAAHKSSIILVLAYLVTYKFKNTKLALIAWFVAIPLSLALGSFWESFFLNFGFGDDDRLQGYFTTEDDEFQAQVAASMGFRWDFLLYSGLGVFAGYYFIIKRKFEDIFYRRMYIFYLITNAFWILVIKAEFSNRFAYLSWFILGALIIYPFLKREFFQKQNEIVGKLLFGYFMITFLLNVIIPRL